MADDTVALQAKGYDPTDMVAPLQAYSQLMQGQKAQIDNQQNQLALAARQNYVSRIQGGEDPTSALQTSGMGIDPVGEKNLLANVQTTNTLNALKSYAADPSNPGSLAPAGPAAVGEASSALGTQAATASTQQDVEAKKANLRGQIGLGFMTAMRNAKTKADGDLAWYQAVGQAHSSGLVLSLQAQNALDNIRDPNQRMLIARQWAAAGAGSVVNSGDAEGAITRQKNLNDAFVLGQGQKLDVGPGLRNAMFDSTPTASQMSPPPASAIGRSAATGGPQASQPPVMTQAENAHNLPSGWLGTMTHIESRGDPTARSPSGAMGLMQIMPDTWRQYARPGQNPYNPQDSIEVGSRIAADYQAMMTRALGRQPTSGELYLAYQQGPKGAIGLLSNPNAPASSIIGSRALIANGGAPSMTAGQFALKWMHRFENQGGGNFSLSGPSPMGAGVQMPSAPQAPAAALPAAGMVGLRAAAGATPPQPDLMPQRPGAPPAATATPSSAPATAAMAPTNAEGRSASDGGLPPTRSLMPSASAGGFTTVDQGMSPFQLEQQHGQADIANQQESTAREQFVTANAAQTGLMQLQDDLTKLTPTAGSTTTDRFLGPGSGADTRIGFAKQINSLLQTAGYQPVFDPSKIAAAESANKVSGRLGFDLAGGREAGFIVERAIGLNPTIMNTPQGSKLLISTLLATQQRQKDFYLYQQQYKENNGGNPLGSEILFDQNRPPMKYVEDAQRLSQIPQRAVKILQQHANNPAAIATFNKVYGDGLARYWIGSRTE